MFANLKPVARRLLFHHRFHPELAITRARRQYFVQCKRCNIFAINLQKAKFSTHRSVEQQQQQQHESSENAPNEDAGRSIATPNATISLTFLRPDGSKINVKSSHGKTLYDAVIDNNVDIDGFGACGGTLCCTTCHLIFKQADYAKVGEPSVEELDMLELAHGLEDTSRLGCQVTLKKDFDPLEVRVPENINDIRLD